MGQRWPDCDPAVRRWVRATVDGLLGELGGNAVGAWLHGSLASGSFHPPKSDVDVLFVVREPLAPAARERFARACVRLSRDRPLVGGLECSVVLASAARGLDHPAPFEAHYGEEHADEIMEGVVDFAAERRDADLAAHFQAVREHGVVLAGPPPGEVFGPVPRADFLDSVHADLGLILSGEHVLESPYYAVLNACRLLWVWNGHSGRLVPTKEEAGEWAAGLLPPELVAVVEAALEAYRDDAPVGVEERTTGGRAWDRAALLAFRDHVRRLAPAEVLARVRDG